MRSLHIIGSRQPGGAEGFFVRLVKALHAADHDATALVAPASAVAQSLGEEIDRIEVKMRGHWDMLARYQIERHIARLSPDMVLTYLGRATRLVHLPPRRRPLHIARLGGYYNLRQYRHAHAWVGNTRGICDYMITNGLPPARVFHIPNFVDQPEAVSAAQEEALRAALQLPADACVVLALGRLHTVKGFDILLQACALLSGETNTRPLFVIILGAGGEHERLEALAQTLQLRDRVRFPGWKDSLSPYFALADVFVCSSRVESFGNVLLDAWSHGVPLIATRTAGAEELVHDGENGLLVPVEDVAALAAALRDVLNAFEAQRKELVAAGHATLAAHYSRPAVVQAYLKLFRELLAQL